jgi:hypothetical protein
MPVGKVRKSSFLGPTFYGFDSMSLRTRGLFCMAHWFFKNRLIPLPPYV